MCRHAAAERCGHCGTVRHVTSHCDNMQARQCARCTGAVRRTKRPAERCADPNKACGGRTLPRFGQSCQRRQAGRQAVVLRVVHSCADTVATFRKLTALVFVQDKEARLREAERRKAERGAPL